MTRKEILSRIEFYEEKLKQAIEDNDSLDIACCKRKLAEYRAMLNEKVSA